MLIEVFPGVFVRNGEHEQEDDVLERAGITCVVEAASDGGGPAVSGADSPVERLRLPILGLKGEPFVATFRQASDCINKAVDAGGRVLVQGLVEEWRSVGKHQWHRSEFHGRECRTLALVAASLIAKGESVSDALELVTQRAGMEREEEPQGALRTHLVRGLAAFAANCGASPLDEPEILNLVEKFARPATPQAALAALPWRTGVPLPGGSGERGASTAVTFKDGHTATVQTVMASPRICVVPGFISGDEARQIVALAQEVGLKQSLVATTRKALQDGLELTQEILESEGRTSRSCPVNRNTPPVAAAVVRAAYLLDCHPTHSEATQVVSYDAALGVGTQRYDPHLDWFQPDSPYSQQRIEARGQREVTALVYLSDAVDEGGGATYFPDLDLRFAPQRGTAVVWYNRRSANEEEAGEMDERVLHAGEPVLKGNKLIMNLWFRERAVEDASSQVGAATGYIAHKDRK
ncbi:hypothetical protein T484DRAFT_3297869 [Baffinella frigidus]|nr:hypothetical protein T484DRAFT_3297869 [Cryptophyta sp. CCMP2293]